MSRFPIPSWLTVGGVALAVALLALSGGHLQPAGAQVGPPLRSDFPIVSDSAGLSAPVPTTPQVQALDASHFVVVTRETRLARKANTEGPWQNMLVTVVTYYSVQNGKLTPVEHVRVPQGYRAYGQ